MADDELREQLQQIIRWVLEQWVQKGVGGMGWGACRVVGVWLGGQQGQMKSCARSCSGSLGGCERGAEQVAFGGQVGRWGGGEAGAEVAAT